MAYEVRFSPESVADLDKIYDHLSAAYLSFGDSTEEAYSKSSERVIRITAELRALKNHPHRGTVVPHLRSHLRNLTKDRAVAYFEIDETSRIVHVLAVFFGGQDHRVQMAERLSRKKPLDA